MHAYNHLKRSRSKEKHSNLSLYTQNGSNLSLEEKPIRIDFTHQFFLLISSFSLLNSVIGFQSITSSSFSLFLLLLFSSFSSFLFFFFFPRSQPYFSCRRPTTPLTPLFFNPSTFLALVLNPSIFSFLLSYPYFLYLTQFLSNFTFLFSFQSL